MELTAVISALSALRRKCPIIIHTDSSYVKDGITKWIHGWKRNGWRTADKKPVKNAELWQQLDELTSQFDIEWRWVKGHAGDPGNEKADELAKELPNSFIPGQFVNPANPAAHYATTGPEIWKQTDGKVDIFVAGVGTGGTISGTGKYLKEASNGAVKVIGSDPEGSIYSASSRDEVHQYDIEGVGEDFYPKAFDRNITDDIVRVSDAEAFEMTRRLGGEEALLVGGSSGMAVASAIKYALANDLDENQIVVVLAPDSGRSYLEKIFNDDWMRANGYGDIVERASKPSLAEQYLNGTPSDEGAADGLHN